MFLNTEKYTFNHTQPFFIISGNQGNEKAGMNNGIVFMGVLNRTSDAVLMIDKAPEWAGKLPIKPAHTEQKSPLSELHRTLLTADTQSGAPL